MAEKCHVIGKIVTNRKLTLSGCEIKYGKWTAGPHTSIEGDEMSHIAFEAKGRSDTATGTEGWLEYTALDGARFRLYFDDPFSNANQATITGVSGQFPSYDFSLEYPGSGKEWDVVYTIKHR